MASFENILPRKQSLEALVMSYCDEIDERLEAILSTNGDIIEPNNEIHHDIVTTGRFADFCSQFFTDTKEQQPEVSSAIYRSICFAEQVTYMTRPENYQINLTGKINHYLQEYNSIDGLVTDTQSYLQHRDELDSLVTYYSPKIDPSSRHHHVVKVFTSMFFMLTERDISEQQVASQFDHITPEDIINYTHQP